MGRWSAGTPITGPSRTGAVALSDVCSVGPWENRRVSKSVAERAIRTVAESDVGPVTAAGTGMSSEVWKGHARGQYWAVRIPIPDSGRRPSYRSEHLIGEVLTNGGLPVARWTLLEVDGIVCSVAPWLPGDPIDPDREWADTFGAAVASVLTALHTIRTDGWGPLEDTPSRLQGISAGPANGIVDRWFHAPIWPFDRSALADHPVARLAPQLVTRLNDLTASIKDAALGNRALVHSDLHPQHLLLNQSGELSGVLDFGDAFIGSAAWDFALITHYYGPDNVQRVAAHYPDGHQLATAGKYLAVAVSLYKCAKTPRQVGLVDHIRHALAAIDPR